MNSYIEYNFSPENLFVVGKINVQWRILNKYLTLIVMG